MLPCSFSSPQYPACHLDRHIINFEGCSLDFGELSSYIYQKHKRNNTENLSFLFTPSPSTLHPCFSFWERTYQISLDLESSLWHLCLFFLGWKDEVFGLGCWSISCKRGQKESKALSSHLLCTCPVQPAHSLTSLPQLPPSWWQRWRVREGKFLCSTNCLF